MNKTLIAAVILMLASCADKNDMEGFQVFKGRDEAKIVSMDSVIEKTSVVLLDTSSKAPLLGEISFLYEAKDSYYIISGDTAVYEYDKTGKYIRKIGAEGRGPGEYLSARGLYLNDALFVFDFPSQKTIKYDKVGNYIQSDKLEFDGPNLYMKSFFVNQGEMIFYALNNSSSMSLFEYENGMLSPLSQGNRTMLPGEPFVGGVVSFGDSERPYIYNENFNDTVYVVENHKLVPSYLMKLGNYRYDYKELSIEQLISSTKQKVQTVWISAAGNFLFISYYVSNLDSKNDGYFLGLYNFTTKEYFQNVEFTNPSSEHTTIRFNKKLYQGYNPNEMLSVRILPDSEDAYVLVKYKVK